MTDGPLHFTMRELQRTFFAPRFWAAIAGASVLLGLIGPFGTFEAMALSGRLAYWATIAVSTYFIGGACVFLFVRAVSPGRMPGAAMFGLAGAIAGIPVALVVWGINAQVFTGPGEGVGLLPLVAYTIAISAVVSALLAVFGRLYEQARSSGASAPEPKRPRIADRLPPAQRGRLTHMSMQDHYVDVRTTKGGGLVLMRFADAVAETDGAAGLQIHRSHWVANDAVEKAVRRDGKLFLKLSDGTELPVSRSFQAAVKEAGLLAR
ncbi:MAG: LytTR family transcriptional regulator DNA-binding domain-containing protein [Rhizobiaceae bacterium]